MRWGWLSTNPAELAKPPRFVQAEVHPPTPAQVAQLLNAAWERDPDFATLLWLAMTTGARRGSCARWPDVRFEERDLLVARNYVQRGRHRKEKDTKTHQSRRIALDEETIAVLAKHLGRCRARAGTGRVELVPDGYVFSLLPDGSEPLVPDSVTQRFRRLAKRVGVPHTPARVPALHGHAAHRRRHRPSHGRRPPGPWGRRDDAARDVSVLAGRLTSHQAAMAVRQEFVRWRDVVRYTTVQRLRNAVFRYEVLQAG